MKLRINGRELKLDVPADTPLLWVLREELNLKGTKFGCGKGLCGACTIHVDGQAVRSCITPLSLVQNRAIETIEYKSSNGGHIVQKKWIKHSVPQCGYCQSGQLMQAIATLEMSKGPINEDELIASMSGNICRCGTYHKIKEALVEAARDMGKLR